LIWEGRFSLVVALLAGSAAPLPKSRHHHRRGNIDGFTRP